MNSRGNSEKPEESAVIWYIQFCNICPKIFLFRPLRFRELLAAIYWALRNIQTEVMSAKPEENNREVHWLRMSETDVAGI